MKRTVRLLGFCAAGILAVGLLTGLSPQPEAPTPARGFHDRLAEALQKGEIDENQAALYRLYAVVAAERLPAHLRTEAEDLPQARRAGAPPPESYPIDRCGTLAVRAARARLASMPPELRAEVEALIGSPRPQVRTAPRTAGKTASHAFPNWIETPNFSIEWGPNLTNEDGSVPLRDDNANGIPDVAELWASYFEATYQQEVVTHGFSRSGLTANLVPVYLGNSDPSTTLDNISGSTYAITYDDLPTPYVLVNNNLQFVPPNGEGSFGLAKIRGAMKVTAAHEFFHVLQFLTPLPYAWNDDQDDWWLETSATWMEDEVFDAVDDYYQYFPGTTGWARFVEAGLPVNFNDPHYITRAYGGVIFAKYLSEHVGGAASIKDIWTLIAGSRRILNSLDVYAQDKGFAGLGELFLGFAGANATMDYREGPNYGAVPVRKESLSANSSTDGLSVPDYLGATYLRKTVGTGGLTASLTATPASTWGLALSLSRGTEYSVVFGSTRAGSVSQSVTHFDAGDTLYAIPCFLQAGGTSLSYSTTELAATPPTAGIGAVTSLQTSPVGGGFDLSWTPPTGAAGSVVQWRSAVSSDFTGTHTVFGPIGSIEVRGLASGSYVARVFAYDSTGNDGPKTAVTDQFTVSSASPTPTPPAQINRSEISAPPSNGSGGGGGGGCFLESLSQ